MAIPAHWWKARPAWLDPLRAAEVGESGGEGKDGWTWLSERQSREVKGRARKAHEGDARELHGWIHEDVHDRCREMIARAVPLAQRGGFFADRGMRKIHNPTLFGDPSRPEQAWLALDEAMPAIFWVPAGTTAASLAEAFEPYALPEREGPLPRVLSLPRSVRIFVGTDRDMGATFEQIADYFRSLPGTDSLPWSERFMDDPWPARLTGLAAATAGYRMAEMTAPIEGAVPRRTVRTRRLGAAISVQWMDGFCVIEVQYAPVAHASLIDALASVIPEMPKGLPPDLPVDALTVLARCRGKQAGELLAAVRDPGEREYLGYHAMSYLAVLGDDGDRKRALLRELLARPDVEGRRIGFQLASTAHEARVMHDALLAEHDADTREAMRRHLSPRTARAR